MKGLLLLLVPSALAVAQTAGNPPAPKRYALLVANSRYQLLPPIPAAAAEIGNLDRALKDAGFETTLVSNADRSRFGGLMNNLSLQPGDIFFFYFSGYTSTENSENYLLPVDFDPKAGDSPQNRAPALGVLQQRAEERTQGLKILMLDTVAAPGSSVGLQAPDLSASHETLFALAGPAGPASDPGNPQTLGQFTRKVIANISKPGSRVITVFEGAPNNLSTEFYFHRPVEVTKRGSLAHNSIDGEDYVWIPPGTFQMGCVPGDEHCKASENPRHKVTITKGFWMGRNEVQVLSYKTFTAEQPAGSGSKVKMPRAPLDYSGWSKLDYPMVSVSWDDASKYCRWAGGRLPTEAEWEYAARGESDDSIYPFDLKLSHNAANFSGNDLRKKGVIDRAIPVHKFSPNSSGLFDMAGNVWEWVQDFYDEHDYSEMHEPITDPQGPKTGKEHVARGGGFDSQLNDLRISNRGLSKIGTNDIGFRCVLEDTPETRKLLVRP